MSEILQTNIFFFITSVAVVFVTILAGIVLFYVVMILKDIKDVSERVKKGVGLVGKDLAALRREVKKGGTKAQSVVGLILSRFMPTKKNTQTKTSKKKN